MDVFSLTEEDTEQGLSTTFVLPGCLKARFFMSHVFFPDPMGKRKCHIPKKLRAQATLSCCRVLM